jgi:tetratricopeptide (TPR) repeat protein
VARLIPQAALMAVLLAVSPLAAQPPAQPPHEEPEEEDASAKPKEYSFNPLQAEQEVKVGRFYMRRGSHKAAAGRFEEAVKWNPQMAEAWLLLGEAREKIKDFKGAKEAYLKYLELAPDAKNGEAVKKRLGKLG